jgi:hypothetical protein
MPTRTTESSERQPNQRWRVNSSGIIVNTDAEPDWDLDIGRLKIGDVTNTSDEPRVPIHTPPKSKIPVPVSESSPLDSASNPSVGSSPHVPDHPISHSRGSSADTTISSTREPISNTLIQHPKVAPAEAKERPHSFSGGLSTADLRRLQQAGDSDHDRQLHQQQWSTTQYREQNAEQLSYPSLTNNIHRPSPQISPQAFNNYPSNAQVPINDREDIQVDYNAVQRNFAPHVAHGPVMNPMNAGPPHPPQFVHGRPNNGVNYRHQSRNFASQGPSPPPINYAAGHHTPHLSLGNTQQLYEMMLPGPLHDSNHPAVTRVQQQHNVFRGTHHHSASDPSAIRDVAALQLLNSNMQTFNPNIFQPGMPPPAMSIYHNQYFNPQDIAVQQAIAARLQAQYTGSYNISAATPTLPVESDVSSPTNSNGQTGPSANNRKLGLYKTELCRSWEEKGSCRYGNKCQFAHGEGELRKVARHSKYKTEICKTFWVSGSCPYGKRCCFIHTELSAGAAAGVENAPPQAQSDGRERSNSDPDASSSISLLTRISQRGQVQQETPTSAVPPPSEINSSNGFPFTRPPTGSLRVDTALDGPSIKQNKSAYPSFASNGILLPAPEHITAKSPAPVTAGPDLGRHNVSRVEIVGYSNHQKRNSTSASNSNPRHSFSGTEVDLGFNPSPPASVHSYGHGQSSSENSQPTPPSRVNGHVRAGSAGNWGSITRSSHLSTSAFPHGPSAAGEIMSNSPWSSTELAVGSSLLHQF